MAAMMTMAMPQRMMYSRRMKVMAPVWIFSAIATTLPSPAG